MHNLQELQRIGVASLKIEGRMKRPEYVAAVTQVYRQALDTGNVTRAMDQQLHTAFNRQGFTNGYYAGSTGAHMFGVREDTQENTAWQREIRQTYEAAEASRVPVRFHAVVRPEGSQLTVTDPEGRVCSLNGPAPEPARMRELTFEELSDRLAKTGGTPYRCENVTAELASGLMLSASAINAMRRDVLNLLTAQRARRDIPHLGNPRKLPQFPGSREHPAWTVQVTSREQITGRLLKTNPAVLYVPLHILAHDLDFCQALVRKVHVCAVLPRIVHDGELPGLKHSLNAVKLSGVREVLVGNIGLLLTARECGMRARGDFGLNLYNSGAVYAARELELRSACLSFEMTLPQIRDVGKAVPCEILGYGRMPLMVTENCLIKGKTGSCSCHLGPTKLSDKTGSDFPVIRDGDSCRSVLLNGKKLNWLDRQDDLARLGLWAVRLYFTTENSKEVDQVLAACQNPPAFDPGSGTRGLYLRGLE